MHRTLLALLVGLATLGGIVVNPSIVWAEGKLVEPDSGESFEAESTYNGTSFICLATGLRKKFVVKVYAAAFCLEKSKAADTLAAARAKAGGAPSAETLAYFDAIRDAPVAKTMDMAFVRDVDRGKIAEAFEETLRKALGDQDKDGQARFVALVDRDVKKGEHIVLTTQPDGSIHLSIGGQDHTLTDPKVARYIWNAWLGPDSVVPALKEMLVKRAGP
jgi:hypothetical protein